MNTVNEQRVHAVLYGAVQQAGTRAAGLLIVVDARPHHALGIRFDDRRLMQRIAIVAIHS